VAEGSSVARRLLRRGAGGILAAGVVGLTVLAVEGWVAARRQYVSADLAPTMSGAFGADSAPSLRLLMLGDSSAAGLGVDETEETVGGRLSELIASTGRRVQLDSVAVTGSRAADLGPQVSRALVRGAPDIAVILIGANDATHFTPLDEVERNITAAVRRLRAAGSAVVVGTCPDLGAVRNFAQPLRELVGWAGRRVAAASERAAVAGGGVTVDLAARTGPVFRADPGTLSGDQYHPSADGYQLWALALYPAVYEAASSVRQAR
jgi:lysophospholipase L1-like esterase